MIGKVADPKFESGRGIYYDTVSEVVTTATEGAKIIYTLGGYDPSNAEVGDCCAYQCGDVCKINIDPSEYDTPGVVLRVFAKYDQPGKKK